MDLKAVNLEDIEISDSDEESIYSQKELGHTDQVVGEVDTVPVEDSSLQSSPHKLDDLESTISSDNEEPSQLSIETKPTDEGLVTNGTKLPDIKVDQLFRYLKQKAEDEYIDEMGKSEAAFYSKGKTNDAKLLPKDLATLKEESLEQDISETFNEMPDHSNDAEQDIKVLPVRTLTGFSFYDHYGNMIKLSQILERPYMNYTGEIVVYGTVTEPLSPEISAPAASIPCASKRRLVRQFLEQPIPRGFRHSELGSITPKEYIEQKITGRVAELPKPKKKTEPKAPKTSRPTHPKTNLHFEAPTYDSSISRLDAYTKAKQLRSTVSMPLKVGNISVVCLGTIEPPEAPNANLYHNEKHLFAVGFKSVRLYGDLRNPTEHGSYSSEILRGENGPVFRVTYEEDTLGSPIYEANTSSAVWLKVLKALNEAKVNAGLPAKGTSISGPEMMGFAHKKIASVLEGLEGAAECENYIFRAQRVDNVKRSITATKRKFQEADISPTDTMASVSLNENDQLAIQTLFNSEDSSIRPKKTKTEHNFMGHTPLNLEQVNEIKRISKQISLICTNEEKQLLNCMITLRKMRINFQVLNDTGVGMVISRLKRHSAGDVASMAKSLKSYWRNNREQLDASLCSSADRHEVRKICSRLTSYVGFGDETPPPNFRAHLSKHSARMKLLSMLSSLENDFEYIPVSILMETNIGKRVNKLRKHLDEDIQTVALKLKGQWKKQIETESQKAPEFRPVPVSKKKQIVEAKSLSLKDVDSLSTEKPKHARLNEKMQGFASLSLRRARLRIKLDSVIGLLITHRQHDATLWLHTDRARYRIAGEKTDAVPSHRYYSLFLEGFHMFQTAFCMLSQLKIHLLRKEPAHLSQPALRKYKISTLMDIFIQTIEKSKHCPCPALARKQLKLSKEQKYQRLNMDRIVRGFETILDEITRLHEDETKVSVLMSHWIIENLVNRGNCGHSKQKKESVRREREHLKIAGESFEALSSTANGVFLQSSSVTSEMRLKAQAKRMVAEGINLPDDLDIAKDDLLSPTERKYGYLPPEGDVGPAPTPFPLKPDLGFLDLNEVIKTSKEAKMDAIQSPNMYGVMLSLWIVLVSNKQALSFLQDDDIEIDNFTTFRNNLTTNNNDSLHMKLLTFLMQDKYGQKWDDMFPENSSSNSHYSITDGELNVTTRSTSTNGGLEGPGFVMPLSEVTDKTSNYTYNLDQGAPFPRFLITELSWPELCRRLVGDDLMQERINIYASSEDAEGFTQSSLLDAKSRPSASKLLPRVDLLDTCQEILQKTLDNPLSSQFSSPVSLTENPDYETKISRRMDLSTVLERLKSGHYDEIKASESMKQDYLKDIVMPVIKLQEVELKGEQSQEEDETASNADEADEEEQQDNAVQEEYVIPRKIRKKGAWKVKSEYQLGVDLNTKIEEVSTLLTDEKFYKHDCLGAGHQGVLADVRQVWRNCAKYNKSFTKVVNDSKKLGEEFLAAYHSRVTARDYESQVQKTDQVSNGVENPHIDQILDSLPSLGEVALKLDEQIEFASLPVPYRVKILQFLVEKSLESDIIKNTVSKNVEELLKHDKELADIQKSNPADMEQLEAFKFKHETINIRFHPLGEDRHRNRYWFSARLLQQFGMVLVQHFETGAWSYFSESHQLDTLFKSLDIRGRRENALHREMKSFWLETAKKYFILKDIEIKENLDVFINYKPRDKEVVDAEKAELEKNIRILKAELVDIEPEARLWATALSGEGKEYYYHTESRKTTWILPSSRVKEDELKIKLSETQAKLDILVDEINPESIEAKKQKSKDVLATEGGLHRLQAGETVSNSVDLESVSQKMKTQAIKHRIVKFLASLTALEAISICGGSGVNYSPRITTWLAQERQEWVADLGKVLESMSVKEGELTNFQSVLASLKLLLKKLFKQYCGDPYPLDHLQAQEAVLRCARHENRINRAIDFANTLSQLGLIEAQIRHVLALKVDQRYQRVLAAKTELLQNLNV